MVETPFERACDVAIGSKCSAWLFWFPTRCSNAKEMVQTCQVNPVEAKIIARSC